MIEDKISDRRWLAVSTLAIYSARWTVSWGQRSVVSSALHHFAQTNFTHMLSVSYLHKPILSTMNKHNFTAVRYGPDQMHKNYSVSLGTRTSRSIAQYTHWTWFTLHSPAVVCVHLHSHIFSCKPARQWRSGPTHSLLVAKFLQRSVVACSTRILCCKEVTLRTRPRTGVCEPDVVAPKAHQSYVSSVDLPSDSLRKN